jgi:hypothetical protein
MKVLLSGFVSDLNNKCGDIVASHNRYGLFFRERKDTPASGSTYWTVIRDQTILLSNNWALLTENERLMWNLSARDFKRSDNLGIPYYQSGFNFFVGTNLNRWFCSEAQLNEPPAPVYVPLFESLYLVADSSGPSKVLNFTPTINAAYKVKLWCTNALSAGITRAFHQYRLLSLLDDSFTSGDSFESDFMSRFLSSGSSGLKIFVKAIFVHKATGLVGQPIYADTIIV